jgi:hypothetical protein
MARLAVLTAFGCALLAAVPTAPAGAAARLVPPRFTGVVWDKEIQDAPLAVQHEQWATMAASGVETTRVIFAWHLAQPKPNRPPSFDRTDVMVEESALHGIELLPVVTGAPPWARVIPGDLASAPLDQAGYVRYLSALVHRYGPRGSFWAARPDLPRRPIRAWQVWNEPHLPWQFAPNDQWPRRYGHILRRSYRAIKRADPGATVVLAGLANLAWEELGYIYDFGHGRGYFDVATIHIYSATPEDFAEIVRRFRRQLDRHGDRRVPIWITEAGASASYEEFRAPGMEHFQMTDDQMAGHIPLTYDVLARERRRTQVERVYWYTWASPYTIASGVFGYSGLNAYEPDGDVQPRPALLGYQQMAFELQGCHKDVRARCVR